MIKDGNRGSKLDSGVLLSLVKSEGIKWEKRDLSVSISNTDVLPPKLPTVGAEVAVEIEALSKG